METLPIQDLTQQRQDELLMYIQNFYRRSWDWRSTFHARWDKYDRNYHGIYDPARLAKKEPWQSHMFADLTIQNCEIITSQIFKTMMAPKPPIQTEAGPDGDDLQARLIQDIVAYELDKAGFEVAFYDGLKEAVRYGSGFMKFFWERVEDTRMRRTPITENPQQVLDRAPMQSLTGQAPMPTPAIQGFQMAPQVVLLKNQLATTCIHIRDVFPEPNTKKWDKVIHRDKIPYGTIVRHIMRGEFLDAREKLENVVEGDHFESDITAIKQEMGYFDSNRKMAKFEKEHTVWEFWGPVPRKWIQFDIPEGDQAEELVPAKVMVASGIALLCSEENTRFDGESPILKIPYIRTGNTYDKGIPELIQDDQDEINEHVNLGIDNMNLILNKGLVVLENALVNAEQDLVSKPGMIVRMKQQVVDDVRKGFAPIEFPDLASSYFKHRFEIERGVQEKTGASRVTLGSSAEVRDTNQTLGGMELLKQMFNERVAAYGMVIEHAFLIPVAQKVYGLIFQELKPNDLKVILGDHPVQIGEIPGPMGPQPLEVPRFLAFAYPPPELVNSSYRFKPMGIFSLENKVIKAAQIMDLIKLYMGDPRFDSIAAGKYAAVQLQQIDEAAKWFINMPLPAMAPPGAPPGIPGAPPPLPNKQKPGMQGGPNGNQPNFLPPSPDPLRRQPVPG